MIEFRLLGPLEVICNGERVALGGVKQRALLGRLLLEPNQVVSISRLMDALWPIEEPPVTARKILQNSVWSLRSTLNSMRPNNVPPVLTTQSPGYMLDIDENAVDLHVFQRKLESGRQEMASGRPTEAICVLREALDLWRGDVLADLAEAGHNWPESTLVDNTRADALELYYEAKIARGYHREAIGGIEKLVEAEPLREGSAGLLMLALYRSGRQTEALRIYSRTHSKLVEDFGLEPGPSLRRLQERILSHDPTLDEGGPDLAVETGADKGEPQPLSVATRLPAEARVQTHVIPGMLAPVTTPDGVLATAASVRRCTTTIVIVRAHEGTGVTKLDPSGADELLAGIHALLRMGVECCGGQVLASVGSATIALFNHDDSGDNAARAVQLALLLRDSLDMSDEQKDGLTIRALVATGDLQWRSDIPDESHVSVNGALLDQCWETFPLVPVGAVWVCDRTRSLTSDTLRYTTKAEEPQYWVADGNSEDNLVETSPFLERDHEMEILRRTFDRVEQRGIPHLITVLGNHGTGKTRLLSEFCRLAQRQASTAPLIVRYRVSRSESVDKLALAAELHSREMVDESHGQADSGGSFEDLVRDLALNRPVMIVVDDLHLADDETLEFFERLGTSSLPGKLLVVTSANEGFHRRYPHWGADQPNSNRIVLEPLSVDAVTEVFDNLVASIGKCIDESTWRIFHRTFGLPQSESGKRVRLMRAIPLVVGTNSFPGEFAEDAATISH
ncbi:BTAD domain-containing putative transcriptional regulator [Nocardiopsis rhodophaea]|uniref:BTAD domain-containing putative transcriptional regulator n=1 Tax=Nocardiopsis rhodophaea TaxID=280238 RepID=UPI0031D87BF1